MSSVHQENIKHFAKRLSPQMYQADE